MYDVFISYSRIDSSIAQAIYNGLTDKGLNVFFDMESIRSESFPAKIAKGIKESKIILFIASRNSVTSNYAPDEFVFAKNNKSRNAIIVYRIDNCRFPDDIELLFSSLNQRYLESDSIEILFDDILHSLAQGEISSYPRVSKNTNIDTYFRNLYNDFYNQNYYLVIQQEIENGFWKENWNHHLLLMKAYGIVGDRGNYGILLNMYQTSGILFFPEFYGYISQLWDMIKLGYIKEAQSYLHAVSNAKMTNVDKICYKVNATHIALFSGNHQDALNQYKELLRHLSIQDRYSYLLKDFNTLRWLGYNQFNNKVMLDICSNIGYNPQVCFTTFEGHLACHKYEKLLSEKRWHWREGRTHIVLSFRSFNDYGNTLYYFVEHDKNILGKLFDTLPYGLDETDRITRTGKAFCQYRLTYINGHLIIEEFNPLSEEISCGEIIRLTQKDLHIQIIKNGNAELKGKVRKFEAIGNSF